MNTLKAGARVQRDTGALPTIIPQTCEIGHRIHGAGRRRRNRADLQLVLFGQPVQYTPGEGAMRSAALQGETYPLFARR